MKHLVVLLPVLFTGAQALAAASGPHNDPCAEKRAAIVKQLDEAKARGNDRRAAGLSRALREQEANCSAASIQKEREQDVAEAREKLAERERELQEAVADGKDADKIQVRERKVREARQALHRVQTGLDK